MRKILALLATVALAFAPISMYAQGNQSVQSYVAGARIAASYAYGFNGINGANIVQGFTGTGAQSMTACPAVRALADGRVINLFSILSPILVDPGTSIAETVTPTSVSLIAPPQSQQGDQQCAVISASFTYAHGASQQPNQLRSGTYGVQEAINDIVGFTGGGGRTTQQGGIVVIDSSYGGTSAQLNGTATSGSNVTPFANVTIQDWRSGAPIYWNPTPTGLATAAATGVPVTGQAACDATHQMCSDAGVAGSASWGGTVYAAVTYMDCFGNESPASATTSWTSVASKAIDIASPPAKTGACGWVPYLSLSTGSYALAYQIPVTSSVCTLSTITPLPSCAITNATYGTTASTYGVDALFTGGAQITTYPLSTALMYPVLATTAQTITAQHPLTNNSVSWAYAPSSRVGNCGITPLNMVQLSAAGGISGSSATTVPQPVGSWSVPAGCLNYIGAEVRVSGKFTYTDGGSGTSTKVIVSWEAPLSNTASVPTPICSILDTFTSVAGADNVNYSCTFRVLTTGTTGTVLANGISAGSIAAGQTTLVRNAIDNAVAASAAVNLAAAGRISVQFQATGATSNPGAQALEGTIEILN